MQGKHGYDHRVSGSNLDLCGDVITLNEPLMSQLLVISGL